MPEQQTDVKQNSMLCLWVEELRIIETDIAASIAATPDLDTGDAVCSRSRIGRAIIPGACRSAE